MDGRHIVLASCLGPLHRAACLARREGSQPVAGIVGNLAAEAAADIAGDDANLVLRDAGRDAEQEARDVRVLRGVPDGQLVHAGDPLRHRATRLHRVGNQPLLVEALLQDNLARRQRRRRVAIGELPVEGQIAWRLLVELRRPLGHRRLLRRDDGQRLVVHLDQVKRVLRDVGRIRDHRRHPVTGEAHRIQSPVRGTAASSGRNRESARRRGLAGACLRGPCR